VVGVGALEFGDGLRGPLLKRERPVAIGVQLGERLVPRRKDLVRLDLAVLVLVGT